jgi:hypothetical protein
MRIRFYESTCEVEGSLHFCSCAGRLEEFSRNRRVVGPAGKFPSGTRPWNPSLRKQRERMGRLARESMSVIACFRQSAKSSRLARPAGTSLSQWDKQVATTKVFASSQTLTFLLLAESLASVSCVHRMVSR